MSKIASVLKHRLLLIPLFFVSTDITAGAYIFAETNGPDIVTHPNTYNGSGGTVTVRVCIDPSSPNAADMEYSIQNNVAVYNQLLPTTGNIKLNTNNNIPSGHLDFESVALHEIGHCLGMAHINAASESGLNGNQLNYTKATKGGNNTFDLNTGADGVIGSSDDIRGDDENLVWFRKSNNDPFTLDTVIDSTTYSRNLNELPSTHNFAANADRAVSTLLGHPKTEAVMQQGTYYDEAQRSLGHDDVAALRYAASGIDERENRTRDNYTIQLEYGGISSSNCDISMSFTATQGLAFCAAGGTAIGPNHLRITTASIEFGQSYNWFFNSPNTAPELNFIGNLDLTEGDNLILPISATDAENDTLSYSASGLPAYADLVDNSDGTATLTISPAVGDTSIIAITITVSDDGTPAMSDDETFNINVAALDSDGDGISDYDEINLYGTLPGNPDSDGDFITDGDEITAGSNPSDPSSWPFYADGDVAPLGSPDGTVNAADYLVLQRIVFGEVSATPLELAHGDLHPAGLPDGMINISDLILLLQLFQQ